MDPQGHRNAYQVLGVPETASDREIAAAFRRLARTLHPDFLGDRPEAERVAAETRFKELNQAHESLRGHKRVQYDQALKQMRFEAALRAQRDAAEMREQQQRREAERARRAADQSAREHAQRVQAEAARRLRDEEQMRNQAASQAAEARRGWEALMAQLVWQSLATPTPGRDSHQTLNLTRQQWRKGATFTAPYGGPPLKVRSGLAHGFSGTLRGRGAPGSNGGPAGDLHLRVMHVDKNGRELRNGHRRRTLGGAISWLLTALGLVVMWGIAACLVIGILLLAYAMITGRL